MNFKGIVLAGGKSSRFGKDKALACWEGKTFLERAVDLLKELSLNPVVVANSQKDYSFLSCPVVHDLIPERGPLGGLYTAYSCFPGDSLVVLTCDMPFLNTEMLKKLVEAHSSCDQVTLFKVDEGVQPFPGVYGDFLKSKVDDCFVSEKLSMKLFFSCVSINHVLPDVFEIPNLKNINYLQQLLPVE